MTITPGVEKGSILTLHPTEKMKSNNRRYKMEKISSTKKSLIFNFDVEEIVPATKRSISTPLPIQEMKPEDQKTKKVYHYVIQWIKQYGLATIMTIGFVASISCGLNVKPAILFSLFGFCYATLYTFRECNEIGNLENK